MSQNLQWQSVLARDARFDGTFVYAVRSTGVYCRPSCPSRRPKRDRVEFFTDPNEAERAGFRACRRCCPKTNGADPATVKVLAAIKLIESAEETPALGELANSVSLSPHHLLRSFQKLLGVTPREYADSLRLKNFKHQLKNNPNVTHALYAAGYSSSSRVYENAAPRLGMTPLTYRNGGEGLSIRYTIGQSDFGQVLLAATDKGVCAIKLGDPAQLISELEHEFPNAQIACDDRELHSWLTHVLQHLAGREPDLRLPLHVRSTAFQRQVWQALQQIPYGATASYSEVAKAIRKPRAVRAVARACASNPVCLAIPCHRVIQKNGYHGGYRWGVARKEAILAREAAESTTKDKSSHGQFPKENRYKAGSQLRSGPRNPPSIGIPAHRPD
ncbi:MAG TPA: bifunctional DNA-binding transcriptional regulator/O6-methylguanine-DNA methyltransferase Ada [Terriglobales bacterium]|nr:bifunctional DNA-binding transcriptional regulator/O6-methylguanine-DNA methyltransferase Ada [Terriglobales bacterium]